ncbi:MAG TPA: GMP synthase (glutamine-hydrolyzing) [Candidatus Marinimicrobia bacterium]|nr:GMP synthase (glutamine-hydrolyzing) [Candidatus Neomarinimicrobiota bacterium]
MSELALIIDFGSQYTQLIARRIREMQVYCEIVPPTLSAMQIATKNPKAIILSGGPESVFAENSPKLDSEVWSLGKPILGICYGLQLLTQHFGGKVEPGTVREYGAAEVHHDHQHPLINNTAQNCKVWMSHGDHVATSPPDFNVILKSKNGLIAAIAHKKMPLMGLQFHPEVSHTDEGQTYLHNFLFKIAGFSGDWTPTHFIAQAITTIRETVGAEQVLLGLSGGVDSSVLAFLLHEAIGDRLLPIFIDNGLLRHDEANQVLEQFRHSKIKIQYVDHSAEFLSELEGVTEPEKKRKIIGRVFVEAFEKVANAQGNAAFLAQGTLYPDVIESGSVVGKSHTIKSHHNVGGLPERLRMKVLEPFRELFKDEVRAVGRALGVPENIIRRHPFPGPGLAVRCLGEITPEKLRVIRQSDHIFIQTLRNHDWYDKVWQAFTVLLPVQTVGVMGDQRTFENVIALRSVDSVDGMTANWSRIPADLLAEAAEKIVNHVVGVNRVVYDITSKPPATIEWE